VRPTPDASVPSFVRAPSTCYINKCLRAATRCMGSCFCYMLVTSSASSGCALLAQERSWHCLVLSSSSVGTTKETSLVLLVMDAAYAEGRRALASYA